MTGETSTETTHPHLFLEARPQNPVAAVYDALPFPMLGKRQEVAFDLGITARHAGLTLAGLVFQGYNGHQLLFEQRWPDRVILQHTGETDLTIEAGTGLAVRSLHFLFHGYEPLTHLEVTAVGRDSSGERTQSVLQIPVRYHEQQTDLAFPLQGTWWAIQAADWTDVHKQEVFSQSYALDFVKLGENSQFFAHSGMALEDHFSWEQPVFATAGGKVSQVIYDMPDMLPGAIPDPRMMRDDPRRLLGNAVAVSHGNGEFSYFACLQQASIQVNVGQMIRRGTLLGRVGNSGHSPGPHLHFHLMEGPNPFLDQGLPVRFRRFLAGGQRYDTPTTIPTRMIVTGLEDNHERSQ